MSFSLFLQPCSKALDYLSAHMVDAIITDIRMRKMDGLTFIRKVRQHHKHLPILIISGYGEFQ
ncbi:MULTISPECIES: response regulator [unclassified Paenibacillus]|uniref:response regulator n=1 Tax=unclassified Paenibacillus TaxID=185978 RepID=UPI00020D7B89|nr:MULTISPECIES: response regulator [unclassified Paenibacillus]EGL19141.1 hypothetical protein HMPREF9413_0872 [Paenibacillus sp. HGF7]EPD81172.1 hypothetical protein HMPREF1207_04929 [Paenibacillus sp. HGH0039]